MHRLPLLLLLTACGRSDAKLSWSVDLKTDADDGSEHGEADEDGGGDDAGDGDPDGPACTVDGDGQLPAVEGDFVAQDVPLSATRTHCRGVLHATAGAAGATLNIRLDDWASADSAHLTVRNLLGETLADVSAMAQDDELELVLEQSGEVFIALQPTDPEAAAHDYALTTTCVADCRPFTRYPIILMHGMAGDDAWIGVFDYFVGVEDHLSDVGFLAIAPGADAFNTVEARATQWQTHLDDLEADGIGRRFNLIGHSQGGLDARYLASGLDDGRVSSIITVATPHRGTAVADIATGVLDASPLGAWATDAVASLLATIIGLGEAEMVDQLRDLSTAELALFNEQVPDVEGVYYASWAGRTCTRTDWTCLVENDGEITNAFFALTTRVVQWAEGDNDGLVSVDSAVWGDFRGVLPADHIDSVGIHYPTATAPLDHLEFYEDEARRLAGLGH